MDKLSVPDHLVLATSSGLISISYQQLKSIKGSQAKCKIFNYIIN